MVSTASSISAIGNWVLVATGNGVGCAGFLVGVEVGMGVSDGRSVGKGVFSGDAKSVSAAGVFEAVAEG